jgi:hypothetical protein
MYRYFSLVALILFAVAAMPYPMIAEFRAGAVADCSLQTGYLYCDQIGGGDCNYKYLSCEGDGLYNALSCQPGKGGQATGCDGTKNCANTNNAQRNTNCTQHK